MISLTLDEFDALAPHLWPVRRPAALRREGRRPADISVAGQWFERGRSDPARAASEAKRRISRASALI
jgi:hypothetical protein